MSVPMLQMGSLMYAVLTGRKPFHRDSLVQTLSYIIEGEPPPLNRLNPHVPQPLEAVIRRCMMKKPENRYASTRELARALRELELSRRVPARHWTTRDWIRVSLGFGAPLVLEGGI